MSEDNEKFYPVKGFEGYYEMTVSGIVRSIPRSVKGKGKSYQDRPGITIKPHLTNKGYWRVYLSAAGIGVRRRFSIHRLIAINFIQNPDNLPQINHINGIRTDNNIENLEWCDSQKNNKHTYVLGFKNPNRKLSDEDAIYIFKNGKIGRHGNVKQLSEKFNLNVTNIRNIINGKRYKLATANQA